MHPRFDAIDRRIASWMNRVGHPVHRVTLGLFFVWLGLLKQFGYKTGSSLLAHTVYFGSPETMVPILGWWEVAIGATLLFPATVRISIVLMAARVPAPCSPSSSSPMSASSVPPGRPRPRDSTSSKT
jgi:hypothetical protein